MVELNVDNLGLMASLAIFTNEEKIMSGNRGINKPIKLTDEDVVNLYRASGIIRTCIELYPKESLKTGYTIKKSNGEILSETDEIITNAFYDACCDARLYGHCFLVLETDKNIDKDIKPGEKITGHKKEFNLTKQGDFIIGGYHYQKIHPNRIIPFIGFPTRIKYADLWLNPEEYADSILQNMINDFFNFVDVNENIKYVTDNLAYLLVGMKNLGNKTKTDEGRKNISTRLHSIKYNRNLTRSIAYDLESEDIKWISQSITGLEEVLNSFINVFIASTEYPMEAIFKQNARQNIGSGIQNQLIARFLWSKRVQEWAIDNFLPNYNLLFSRILPDKNFTIEIPFRLELSELEKAELEKMGAERSQILVENGIITPLEARSGYKGKDYNLNIILSNPGAISNELKSKEISKDSAYVPKDKELDKYLPITKNDIDEVMEDAIK